MSDFFSSAKKIKGVSGYLKTSSFEEGVIRFFRIEGIKDREYEGKLIEGEKELILTEIYGETGKELPDSGRLIFSNTLISNFVKININEIEKGIDGKNAYISVCYHGKGISSSKKAYNNFSFELLILE